MAGPVGYIGGFFESLGGSGVATMLMSGAGYGFLHAYISAKIAEWQDVEAGTPKAELATMGIMSVPIATYAGLRYTKYKDVESDALDFTGNIFGAGLLWEVWNAVETIVAMMES